MARSSSIWRRAAARRSGERIVSLAPSATSILTALGARRQLAGVTRWCKDVAPVSGLPALGDCWALDADALMRRRPTLIIGSVPYRAETVARILRIPAPFLAMNPRTLEDIYADVRLLAALCGRPAAGRRLIARMQAAFQRVARRAATLGRRRVRVYCEAWPNPRISSPPWVEELVRLAGGKMAVPAGRRVTDEEVARAAPEVIILAWAATGSKADVRRVYRNAAWSRVPAVVHRRVCVIRDEWLNTPGPPLMRGIGELFRVLHRAQPEGNLRVRTARNR